MSAPSAVLPESPEPASENAGAVVASRPRDLRARPWIVFVSDIPFLPPVHGNRARILQMVRAVREAGYQVAFIYWERLKFASELELSSMMAEVDDLMILPRRPSADTPGIRRNPYAEWIRSLPGVLGAERRKRWSDVGWGKFIGENTRWFGVRDADPEPWCPRIVRQAVEFYAQTRKVAAVVGEYAYAAQVLPAVQKHGVFGVVDTHDCWHRWQQNLRRKKMQPAWFIAGKELETRLLSLADCVLAIQRNEEHVFREMVGADKVLLCEHGMTMPDDRIVRPVAAKSMSLVASNNPFNSEGLVWFLQNVWPLVRNEEPGAELHCYGLICNDKACEGPGIVKHGFVADLSEAYDPHRLVINPVRTGTGLKIKTVEGLLHGRPTVATATGADGVEDADGQGLLLRDDPLSFAQAVVDLLRDEQGAYEAGRRGFAYAERRFASKNVYRPMLDRIAEREPGWDFQRASVVDGATGSGTIRRPDPPSPPLVDDVAALWSRAGELSDADFAAGVRAAQKRLDEAKIPWRSIEFRSDASDIGGAEFQALRIAEGMRDFGFSPRFRIPETAPTFAERLTRAGMPHETYSSKQALAEEEPTPDTVVHLICTHLLDWFPEIESFNKHGLDWTANYQLAGPWRPRWLPDEMEYYPESSCKRMRKAWKGALRLNFVSELNRRLSDMVVGLDDVAHSAILNGVPAQATAAKPVLRTPTSERPFVWLWTGRFDAGQKNPTMALEAFEEALRQAPDVPQELWFVGAGPEEENSRKLAAERGLDERVRFWGWQADTGRFLARADGYLSSSEFEGSSLAVAEAMHAGLAMVVTAVEGNAEEIAHRVTGMLCQRDDFRGMAEGMLFHLREPESSLAMRHRAVAAAREALTLTETQRRYVLFHLDAAWRAADDRKKRAERAAKEALRKAAEERAKRLAERKA